MFSIIHLVALCVTLVSAIGTPLGYVPSASITLGLKYGHVSVTPGSILSPRILHHAPTLTLQTADPTADYLAILVDPTANLTSPIPTSLLWFQTNITFPSSTSAASTSTTPARVPYLAPSVPGHVYIALLYKQAPNFQIPADFPYNAGFRAGFNVSRLSVDFGTGDPVAGNFFELDPFGECTRRRE